MAVPPAPDGEAVGEQSDSTDTDDPPNRPPRATGSTRPAVDPGGCCSPSCSGACSASLVALGRAGWSVDDLVDEQPNPQTERDQVMAVARSFVTEFSAYGPEDLDDQNKMPALRRAGREVPHPQVRDHVRAERHVRRADRRPAAGHPRRPGLRRGSEHARGRLRPGAGGRHRLDLGAEPQEARRAVALLRADVPVRGGPGAHRRGSGWSTTSVRSEPSTRRRPRTCRPRRPAQGGG